MSDGSIVIDTRLDTKGITSGLKESADKIKALTSAFDNQVKFLRELEKELSSVRKEYDAIATGSKDVTKFESFKKMAAELKVVKAETEAIEKENKALIASYEKALSELQQMKEMGFSDEALKSYIAEIDRLAEQLNPVWDNLDASEQKAKKFADAMEQVRIHPETSQEAQDLATRMGALSFEIDRTKTSLNELKAEYENLSAFETQPAVQSIRQIADEAGRAAIQIEKQKQEFQILSDVAERAEKELEAARENGDALAESLAQSSLDRALGDIEKIDAKTKALYYESEKLQELFERIALDPKNADDIAKMGAEASALTFILEDTIDSAKNLSGTIGEAFDTSEIQPAEEEIQKADSILKRLANTSLGVARNIGNIGLSAIKGLGRLTDLALTAARNIGQIGISAVKGIGKLTGLISAAIGGMKRLISNFNIFNRYSRAASNGIQNLGGRLLRLAKNVFVFSLITFAMRTLRENMGALIKTSEQLSKSWNNIKVNLLAAAAPIWEKIQPSLMAFMGVLEKVTYTLASFVSMLAGKTVAQSKEAAEALYNQVKATDKLGKSAKNTSKGLQSFDQVNQNITETSEDAADATDELDFSAVEQPEITWLDELKEKLEALIDPYERAYAIGEALSARFTVWMDNIDWDSIEAQTREWAARLAGFLNGFVDNPEMWGNIGQTLGNGINTAFAALETFIDKFHWKELGEGLAKGFQSLTNTIQWVEIGETIGKGINRILTSIYTFFTTYDWLRLGTQVSTLLNEMVRTIDWALLGATFAAVFMSVIDFLYGAITEFDWVELGVSLGTAIDEFLKKIDWLKLGDTFVGLINGVFSTAYNALEKIDWGRTGKDITGFFNRIIKGIDGKLLGEALSSAVNAILTIAYEFVSGLNWEDIGTKIGRFINTAVKSIEWDKLSKTFSGFINGLFTSAYKAITEIDWKDIGQKITKFFNDTISGIDWGRLGKTLAGVVNSVLTVAYEFLSGFDWANAGVSIGTFFNTAIKNINWKDLGGAVSDGVKGILTTVWKLLETIDWKNVGTSILELLKGIDWPGIFDILWTIISSAWKNSPLGLVIQWLDDKFDWGLFEKSGSGAGSAWAEGFNRSAESIVEAPRQGMGGQAGSGVSRGSLTTILDEISGIVEQSSLRDGETYTVGFMESAGINLVPSAKTVMDDVTSEFENGMTNAMQGAVNGIENNMQTLFDAYEKIPEGLMEIMEDKLDMHSPSGVMKEYGENIQLGLMDGIKNKLDDVLTLFNDIITSIKNTFTNGFLISGGTSQSFYEMGKSLMEGLNKAIIDTRDSTISTFNDMFNRLSDSAERFANNYLRGIFDMVSRTANMLMALPDSPRITVPSMQTVSIPRLARGGIVNKATIAQIGERGREAVLPLENNTGWMDELANRIAMATAANIVAMGGIGGDSQPLNITLETDGKRWAEIHIDDIQSVANRRGINLMPRTI